MSYRADTVVDGQQAQVIDRYAAIQYPQPTQPVYGGPPVITYTPVAVITRFADEVVFLWSGTEWDTLYWFGAEVGQGWTMAHADESVCAPNVVTAAGTDLIDGVPHRWLDFANASRVYERIGSLLDSYMHCPKLIFDGPVGIRCYSDAEITYPTAVVNCTALAGVDEPAAEASPAIHPNPGNERLTLAPLLPGSRIALLDAAGRILQEQRAVGQLLVIDAGALTVGAYLIRVTAPSGGHRILRWMKE